MVTREQEILQAIRDSPKALTIREIGEKVGLRSPSTVHRYVVRLETQGLVRLEKGYVGTREGT